MPEDTPADLDLEHLDAFLLQGIKTIQFYMVLVELFEFPQNDLFDRLDIVSVQVGLEYFLLQVAQLVVCQFTVQILV